MSTASINSSNGVSSSVEPGEPFRSKIAELAAVSVDSTDLDAWERFATEVLGMSATREGDELRLKMDDFPYRFLIRQAERDRISSFAWIARGAEAAKEMREHWEGVQGGGVKAATRGWNNAESVESWAFEDHQGFTHEVHDVPPSGQESFCAGDDVSGFVTGDAGLGHIVMFDDVEQAAKVYESTFGMSLRENAERTQVGGRGRFYGCNPRHHSVAIIEVPGHAPEVMHVMIELTSVDDLGAALDRAKAGGWNPRTALGRHGADHVMSFYVPSPTGFDIEVGYCGLLVSGDDDWDENKLKTRGRSWGHAGIRED